MSNLNFTVWKEKSNLSETKENGISPMSPIGQLVVGRGFSRLVDSLLSIWAFLKGMA